MDGKIDLDTKKKAISRSCSIGCYYCGTAEGVPFKWELQPGTPKHPPPRPDQQLILPPLSPPPALLALGLPKPRPQPRRISLRFWIRRSNKSTRNIISDDQGNDKLETFSFLSSDDCDFMASPRDSMSSSSSSSPSSFLDSLSVPNMRKVSSGRPPSCGASRINRILACFHA